MNQTHDVTEKLGLCADNLGSSNDVAKMRQAAGANPLSADKSEHRHRLLSGKRQYWGTIDK
jgi:hypothetical protein